MTAPNCTQYFFWLLYDLPPTLKYESEIISQSFRKKNYKKYNFHFKLRLRGLPRIPYKTCTRHTQGAGALEDSVCGGGRGAWERQRACHHLLLWLQEQGEERKQNAENERTFQSKLSPTSQRSLLRTRAAWPPCEHPRSSSQTPVLTAK